MSFGAAIQSFWQKYVVFQGRAKRSEYWFVVLFLFLAVTALTVFDVIVFSGVVAVTGLGPLTTLFFLATLLPSLSLLVRRFRDVGMSGWLVLLIVIPFIGPIFAFIVSLLPSQPGSNKYDAGPSQHNQSSPPGTQTSAVAQPPVVPRPSQSAEGVNQPPQSGGMNSYNPSRGTKESFRKLMPPESPPDATRP